MMGSGKTYWAQQLAAAYNMNWIDLDSEIEKENRMSIKEIFETEGEENFRIKEQKALHKLAHYKNIIIATGGGTPCFHNNMQWMNEHGITVWIDEPVSILAKRLSKEKSHRPLIKNLTDNELENFLEQKLKERKSFYSQAKFIINSKTFSIADAKLFLQ
ncbi:MAG: shikimate kinase [Bacteroidetes bacterium]|nr:shikimate kinase [Bacteroidota bacterium]